MNPDQRIYLDNAATSWPKPEAVYAAVDRYLRHCGAPAGRSAYKEAVQAQHIVEQARQQVGALIGAEDPRQIVFTLNGTDALNLALHGLLRPGDHVVTTTAEHNSVLRPLRALQDAGTIEVDRVECDAQGRVTADDVLATVRKQTRLVALIHASNVTGALQPVAEVAARLQGPRLLVDAAQTLGHIPIDVNQLGCDLLAAPGHKGLLGPLGTGLLYVKPGIEGELASVRQGGTGTHSQDDRQPGALPDKYESGNHNVPALAGLAEGVRSLRSADVAEVHRRVQQRVAQLRQGLEAIAGVTVFGPAAAERSVAVVSFRLDRFDPQELAATLDVGFCVAARAGLHCAPLMHRALGTLDEGGTVRFSPGPFTTAEQIDRAVEAVQQIAASVLPV